MASTMKTALIGSTTRAGAGMEISLALLRIFTGVTLLVFHGWKKWPPHEQGPIDGIAAMGLPAPEVFAWFVASVETGAAALLALGLLTRPMALLILLVMGGATYLHLAAMPGIADGGVYAAFEAAELAMFFGLTALVFLAIGGGRFSVDAIIRQKLG